jgi:pilus assembly protein Flp/PilA
MATRATARPGTAPPPARVIPATQGREAMNWLKNQTLKWKVWQDTSGQDLVEYALAAGMVAVAAVAAMPGLSGTVNNVFSKIGSIITANVK